MARRVGEAAVTPILLIGKFWQEPEMLSKLTTGDSQSAVFAKYGLLVVLPDLKIHQWEQFLAATRVTTPVASGNGFTTLQCKCGNLPDAVSLSIANRYQELGIAYQCYRCRITEARSRAQSTLYGGSR
jgi:hypothetical protein